jgi:hypothetical protein
MRKCAMLGVRSGRGQGSGADAELLDWGWLGLRNKVDKVSGSLGIRNLLQKGRIRLGIG